MVDLAKTIACGSVDLVLAGDDLALDRGLASLVLNSVYSDERAELGDLPAEADPRGYWGARGAPYGSLLWLLDRLSPNRASLERVRRSIEAGLAWLTDEGLAESVRVTLNPGPRNGTAVYSIRITRGAAVLEPELWLEPQASSFNLGGASIQILTEL